MRIIQAIANRGKKYRVTFADSGEVTRVAVLVRRAGCRIQERTIWRETSGRQMSLTAKCAARSAVAALSAAKRES